MPDFSPRLDGAALRGMKNAPATWDPKIVQMGKPDFWFAFSLFSFVLVFPWLF